MEYNKAQLFINDLLIIIDNGGSVTLDELEVEFNNKNGSLISFIKGKFGFRNQYLDEKTLREIDKFLKEKIYSVEDEAKEHLINNNGLLYVIYVLSTYLCDEAYQNLWNIE